MPYAIGSTVWHNGTPAKVVSAPFVLYGGEWQDATTEAGKTITVPTPEFVARSDTERIARMRQRVLTPQVAPV
jgi:hypothetical protein